MRNLRSWAATFLGLALVFSAAACTSSGQPTRGPLATVAPSTDPTATPTATITEAEDGAIQLEVHLSRNGSQQSGTVTLTQLGLYTELTIELSPASPVAQPVTLRRGTCQSPTGYVADLDAVVGGILRQEFEDRPIGEFVRGDMIVVVGPSFGTLGRIAACAEIPRVDRPGLPGLEPRR